MTVDSTMTAVQAVPVDAMEEAEVHREEDYIWLDCGFWRGDRTGRTNRNTAGKLVIRDDTFCDVSPVFISCSDYNNLSSSEIERIFSIKTSQKRKKD